ncbi:MAG: hypothetical protein HQL54_08450 [Magnetococcales bacterium]|nr:hypothetical protein [Magnetococcales bacterium]
MDPTAADAVTQEPSMTESLLTALERRFEAVSKRMLELRDENQSLLSGQDDVDARVQELQALKERNQQLEQEVENLQQEREKTIQRIEELLAKFEQLSQ